jgi:hypothetical protein
MGSDLVAVFVDTVEDTILRKLEWYRRTGHLPFRGLALDRPNDAIIWRARPG